MPVLTAITFVIVYDGEGVTTVQIHHPPNHPDFFLTGAKGVGGVGGGGGAGAEYFVEGNLQTGMSPKGGRVQSHPFIPPPVQHH